MVSIYTEPSSEPRVARMVVDGLPKPPMGETLPWRNTAHWSSSLSLDQSGKPWLAAMLPILMSSGETGVFGDFLDRTSVRNSRRIQAIHRKWWPELSRTRVSSRIEDRVYPENRGTACFFSGGVDSFYSVVQNLSRITHLVFVRRGFDLGLREGELAVMACNQLREAAREYGKQFVVVHTNVRTIANRYASWGPRYHGAALATVGLLHAEHFERVLIPASSPTADLHSWGSHPEVDPLWSSSYLDVEHDGPEFRHQKVRAIAADPVAMAHLRVCWRNPDQQYNCGKCEKCLRTMVELYAADALEACATLPDRIQPEDLDALAMSETGLRYAARNIPLLQETVGEQDPVCQALKRAFTRGERARR